MNSENLIPWHYSFRIILIGDSCVGKSTLLKVFTESNYTDDGGPTVGVDFFATIVDLSNGLRVKLQAWDTAGQEKFRLVNYHYKLSTINLFDYESITSR